MTNEQIIQARKMRKDGMTYDAISAELSIPRGTTYWALNPEKKRISNAKYEKGHKKKRHEYRDTHKEDISLYNKRYHQDHITERQLYFRGYEKTHREMRRDYDKTHLPEHAAYQAARRALIVGITIGGLAGIKDIYLRAKEDPKVRCYLCGKRIPLRHRHVDHIIPISKGGQHRACNLAIACDFCNMSKHDKMPEELGLLI